MAWLQRSRGRYYVCWREGGRLSPVKVQAAGMKLSDARRVKAAVEARLLEGRVGTGVLPKRVLFRDFADKWIENRSVRPKTAERERYIIRNHLTPEFGASMVYTITAEEVQTFISRMGKKSPHNARRIHDVLRVMLGDAKSYGYARENVAWDTKRPELLHDEMRVLSLDGVCRLLEAFPARWKPLVLTMLLGGLRWGEAAGLQWADLDLDGGRLHIRRQIVSNTVEVGPPKSRRSLRTIDLLPPLRQALLDLPQRGTWVFSGVRGGPVNHRAFDRRVWLPIVRALRLDLRMHDLRHTCASLLLAFGRNPLYVAAQLGHASADTTLKKYGHLMREGQRLDEADTLRKVEEAYRRAKPVQSNGGNGGSRKLRKALMDAGRGGRI